MKLVTNAFRPWLNGSEMKDVFVGDPEGKPFVVRASERSWLPLNLVIWAQNEEDAIERVKDGLRKSIEMEYNNERRRYTNLLELMEKGTVKVEPFDQRYVCKIDWDSRGLG